MYRAEFSAMGTGCAIASDISVCDAVADVYDFERKWSRFIPTSEINAIGRARGAIVLSPETVALVEFALAARGRSGGVFDPSVSLGALGCGPVGPFRALDVGGVAKGFAADLVVGRLRDHGASFAAVDLGGDVSVADASQCGFSIDVEDPWDRDKCIGQIQVVEGGVATSATTRRRWDSGGRERHHLLDPCSGAPADSGVVQATVVAGSAAVAEVAAKVFVVGGWARGERFAASLGAAACIVDERGAIRATESLAPFVKWLAA